MMVGLKIGDIASTGHFNGESDDEASHVWGIYPISKFQDKPLNNFFKTN